MKPYWKTLFSLILLVTLTTSAMAAPHARYSGSRIFWDSRKPVKIFSGAGYARLIELQDGRLMACSESGGIKIAYSKNGGVSWGTPTTIARNPEKNPNCVPDLIQLRDGTIIVAYNPRPQEPYVNERRYSIRLRRSTDNGATWSQEIVVFDADSVPQSGCWEPSLLELPSGELQLYFADESPYTGSNTDQQISVCRSWDGGLTWSKPDCVSYREGHRDGMPVPILLEGNSTIVVAIEDNGQGFSDFLPTTVRSSTAFSWKNWVDGGSSQRKKAIDYNYCPQATGGAPYLRRMANGETVLSHQSLWNHGEKQNMYVYVGNNKAENFKAMSSPFQVPLEQAALWNSLAVVDSGVVAVAGFGGNIWMVKGYPKSQFDAPMGSPIVDGGFHKGEGYLTSGGNQISMGNETGTFTYADLAYDQDSLYFFCMVYDKGQVSTGTHRDLVTLCWDTEGASYDAPQLTSFRWDITPSGDVEAYVGNKKNWVGRQSSIHVEHRNSSTYYMIELTVAWSDMDRQGPNLDRMSMNLEITNGDGTSHVVERIADARLDETWTWMPLHLIPGQQTGLGHITTPRRPFSDAYDLQGRRTTGRGLRIMGGKKILR